MIKFSPNLSSLELEQLSFLQEKYHKDLSSLELEQLLHRINNDFEGEDRIKLLWQFWEMTHPKEE